MLMNRTAKSPTSSRHGKSIATLSEITRFDAGLSARG